MDRPGGAAVVVVVYPTGGVAASCRAHHYCRCGHHCCVCLHSFRSTTASRTLLLLLPSLRRFAPVAAETATSVRLSLPGSAPMCLDCQGHLSHYCFLSSFLLLSLLFVLGFTTAALVLSFCCCQQPDGGASSSSTGSAAASRFASRYRLAGERQAPPVRGDHVL